MGAEVEYEDEPAGPEQVTKARAGWHPVRAPSSSAADHAH